MVPSTISFFPSIINCKRPAKTPLMEQDAFFYFGEEGIVENLTKYRRGGLHPVHLGDLLLKPDTCKSDGAIRLRYRISQNLGLVPSPSDTHAVQWEGWVILEQRGRHLGHWLHRTFHCTAIIAE